MRRIVTTRTSADGFKWSPDAACPGRVEESCGDVTKNCTAGYNTSGMIVPDPVDDPPELEFCETYRVSKFAFVLQAQLQLTAKFAARRFHQAVSHRHDGTAGSTRVAVCAEPAGAAWSHVRADRPQQQRADMRHAWAHRVHQLPR